MNKSIKVVFMLGIIINIITLSAMCIGLCFSLLPILRFHQKSNIAESYLIVIVIFLPLLYSFLSVSNIVLGNIYLYYMLAILVYTYIDSRVGNIYFLLSSLVIVGYLSILQQQFSLSFAMLVIANSVLTWLLTMLINLLKINQSIKVVLCVIFMLIFETLFCGYVSQNGAHDFNGNVVSVISAILVLTAVHYFNKYLTQRQMDIDELIRQANNDELTGFFNLHHLQQNFSSKIFKEETLAIIMVDLDYFKSINDKYGHTVGNNVLVFFSEKLNYFLEGKIGIENFELYRYGGEEFVVTIKKTVLVDNLVDLFEELQEFIAKLEIENSDEKLSFSAGIAYLENHAYDALRTFESADHLLYLAKETGKKQTRFESREGYQLF